MTKLQSQGMLAHPFKQVRVEVGRLLAVAMSAAPNVAPCDALIAETTRLCTPPPKDAAAGAATSGATVAAVVAGAAAEVAVPMTPRDGDGAAGGTDAEDEETAAARSVTNARDTMLWMSSLHVARSAW